MKELKYNTDHHFILLNKDEILATFHVDERFDTITIDEVFWNAPDWIGDLRLFITNRRAPKHRENIQELLRLSLSDEMDFENPVFMRVASKFV